MTNLQILDASDSKINQIGIQGLNLFKLNAHDNTKITNVSFMTNLKILDASGTCGINQIGILGLNLWNLNVQDNEKINDVTFMTKLRLLNAHGEKCGIGDEGIAGLKIPYVISGNNEKIHLGPDSNGY